MHTSIYFALLIFVLSVVPIANVVQAQEVFFSISGQKSKIESGEKTGVYDIWIRPNVSTSSIPQVEVYDAGLGGFADVVSGGANTLTTYSVFPFNSLYMLTNMKLTPKQISLETAQKVPVLDEKKYVNRWVEVITINQASENGWIIRVETNDGDDVNDFKIRLSGTSAKEFEVISLDLSIGLYKTDGNQRIQLQPLFGNLKPVEWQFSGEENTQIKRLDAWGNDLTEISAWQDSVYGIKNRWIIQLTGANQRLNNLVVSGKSEIIPWIIKPIVLKDDFESTAEIRSGTTMDCDELEFQVRSRKNSYRLPETQWLVEENRYEGSRIRHSFVKKGAGELRVILAVNGRYSPLFEVKPVTYFINDSPKIDLQFSKKVLSPTETVVLSAEKSVNPNGNTLAFAWYVDNVLRGNEPTFSFSNSTSGEYEITLQVSDAQLQSACARADTQVVIRVNTQPYAEIEAADIVALGETTTFKAVSLFDSDNDKLSLSWQMHGALEPLNSEEIQVHHQEGGIFEAVLTVNDESKTSNSVFTVKKKVKVNRAPIPQFSFKTPIAPNENVTFDATLSSDNDTDELVFGWKSSDGQESNGQKLNAMRWSATFKEPGDYTITLTVNDQQGVSNSVQTLEKTLHVNTAPIAVISSVDSTNDAFVEFSAEQSSDAENKLSSYEWIFPNGVSKKGEKVTHLFESSGTYKVTLTVNDGSQLQNSTTSVTKTIVINKNPIAKISPITRQAPGIPFQLNGKNSVDDDGSITEWNWFLNGKSIGNESEITYAIENPGLYSVQLLVKDNSGFADALGSSSQLIQVNFAPVVRWSASRYVVAPNETVTLTADQSTDADSDLLTFTWKFDDEPELSGKRITKKWGKPGNFDFMVSANDGSGLNNATSSTKGSIRVNAEPISLIEKQLNSTTRFIVLDASSSYDPDGKPLHVEWILPDGTKRTESKWTWEAPESGFHKIGIVLDDTEGLTNSKISHGIDVYINSPVIAKLDSVMFGCSGQIVLFSSANCVDPDGDRFSTNWDFGDGNTSKESNPYHIFNQPGKYLVTLTLDDGFSEPTKATTTVIVSGSPKAVINLSDTTICLNTPLVFNGEKSSDPNGDISVYVWNLGDGTTQYGKEVTHLYDKPGTYKVSLSVIGKSSGGCKNTDEVSIFVTVIEGPRASFNIPEWVNPNQPVSLTAETNLTTDQIESATWEISKGDQRVTELTGLTNILTIQEPGNYNVRFILVAKSSSSCKEVETQQQLLVNAAPTLSWDVKETYPANANLRFSAEGTSDSDGYLSRLVWKLNGKIVSNNLEFIQTGLPEGKYDLELEITDNSGVSSGTVSKKQTFTTIAAPKYRILTDQQYYKGETILLQTETIAREKTKQPNSIQWFVDGSPTVASSFKAEKEKYEIWLRVDNGAGFAQSVDTLRKTIQVISPPDWKPTLPEKVTLGTTLPASTMRLIPSVFVTESGKKRNEWKAETLGKQTITFSWMPRDSALFTYLGEVTVMESLEFEKGNETGKHASKTVRWNPANPFITITAPEVNRDSTVTVLYEWISESKTIGTGKTLQLPLKKGKNTFRLKVADYQLIGSKAIETEYVIFAE